MSQTTILSPTGQPLVMIGGDRAWRQRVIRDVVCSFQWLDRPDVDPEGPHPCMILHRVNATQDHGAYVIPQRNAFIYADNKGNPTSYLMGAAFKAAVQLGFYPDEFTVTRLIDVIVEGLGDLVSMPSDQPGELNTRKAARFGIEASASINGKVFHSEVI